MNINALFPQFYVGSEYDTYNYRAELKDRGFKWDADRKQWWHKDEAERDEVESWMPLKEEGCDEYDEPWIRY